MKVAAVALSIVCGCGSGPMIIGGDGGGDLSVADLSAAPDLACLPGVPGAMVACGASACASGQLCCYPSGSNAGACDTCCATGSVGVQCTSPTECTGGKPCCLELDKSQPTSAYCVATQDACPPSLSVGSLAGLSGRTRMCNTDVDCTTGAVDSPYKVCCNSTYFGTTQKICFTRAMTTPGITCP